MSEYTPDLQSRRELSMIAHDGRRFPLVFNPPRLQLSGREILKFSAHSTQIVMSHLMDVESHAISSEEIEAYGITDTKPLVRMANKFNSLTHIRLGYGAMQVFRQDEDTVAVQSIQLFSSYKKAPTESRVDSNQTKHRALSLTTSKAEVTHVTMISKDVELRLTEWRQNPIKKNDEAITEPYQTQLVLRALTQNANRQLTISDIVGLINTEFPDLSFTEQLVAEQVRRIVNHKQKNRLALTENIKLILKDGRPALSYLDDYVDVTMQSKPHRQRTPGNGEPTVI